MQHVSFFTNSGYFHSSLDGNGGNLSNIKLKVELIVRWKLNLSLSYLGPVVKADCLESRSRVLTSLYEGNKSTESSEHCHFLEDKSLLLQIFIHSKLNLLTQFSALNDKKYFWWKYTFLKFNYFSIAFTKYVHLTHSSLGPSPARTWHLWRCSLGPSPARTWQ